MEAAFAESAFRHGYDEVDFFQVLENRPIKLRSQRGLPGVYELLGVNEAGGYLHIAYRVRRNHLIVFHMRTMNSRERRLYRRTK